MSRCILTKLTEEEANNPKPSPRPLVTAGTIYEFAKAHGFGRFQALSVMIRAGEILTIGDRSKRYAFDVWECVSLGGTNAPAGSTKRLDEEEIFSYANELPIQPGQTWIADVGKSDGKPFKLGMCSQTKRGTWWWDHAAENEARIIGGTDEDYLLKNCTRVDGLDAPSVPVAAAVASTPAPAAPPIRPRASRAPSACSYCRGVCAKPMAHGRS